MRGVDPCGIHDDEGQFGFGGQRRNGCGIGRSDKAGQQLHVIACDQLLSQPFGDFRVGPRRISHHKLDLDPGRQLLFVLLHVKTQALVDLVASLRKASRVTEDHADLYRLRRSRSRQ